MRGTTQEQVEPPSGYDHGHNLVKVTLYKTRYDMDNALWKEAQEDPSPLQLIGWEKEEEAIGKEEEAIKKEEELQRMKEIEKRKRLKLKPPSRRFSVSFYEEEAIKKEREEKLFILNSQSRHYIGNYVMPRLQ